jgi:hypothetical protein
MKRKSNGSDSNTSTKDSQNSSPQSNKSDTTSRFDSIESLKDFCSLKLRSYKITTEEQTWILNNHNAVSELHNDLLNIPNNLQPACRLEAICGKYNINFDTEIE